MALNKKTDYFIAERDVVLRNSPSKKAKPVNHLIFGDWVQWRGLTNGAWEKVRCRGDEGWIRRKSFGPDRALEINFVDIGQGDGTHIVTPDDKVIIIDAGKSDNMGRFIAWRYNLRGRRVAGVDGVTDTTPGVKRPWKIDQVVISHPDLDHYYGLKDLFENPKLSIGAVFHNGIVERPITAAVKAEAAAKGLKVFSDLGLSVKSNNGETYLLDLVTSNTAMRKLLKAFPNTTKKYISTLRAAEENPANDRMTFEALSVRDKHLPGFDDASDLTIEIQGPVTERIEVGGKKVHALRKLGNEGVTKNGHSIVFQLRIGKLKVMLGGDLNTEAEDFLLSHYCGVTEEISKFEKEVHELHAKGDTLTTKEKQSLHQAETFIASVIAKARPVFQVDVAKAHHHGSHHFSETFLKAINSIAVVISSGDAEAYSHPRPDALGAFGKYGRGDRPLLFSTEIARSTREFTPIYKHFEKLKQFEAKLAAATSASQKRKLTKEMEEAKDRNVAVYGMITLRTDGEKVFMAQKIEQPSGKDKKWDIHELAFNEARDEFVYVDRTKSH